MPGLPPKPSERRQRRNARSAVDGPALVAMPSHRSDGPPAIEAWTETVKTAWSSFWGSPLATLTSPADFPALSRLFWLYDQAERIQVTLGGSKAVTTGSQGQLVLHPLVRQLTAWHGEILALEDRFGLTPMARLRLGVQYGEAARSLEELTRKLDDDGDAIKLEDPRLRTLDASEETG